MSLRTTVSLSLATLQRVTSQWLQFWTGTSALASPPNGPLIMAVISVVLSWRSSRPDCVVCRFVCPTTRLGLTELWRGLIATYYKSCVLCYSSCDSIHAAGSTFCPWSKLI
ncbi:hypothetical protein PR002_g25047 [Phytophthora rubi]|uniref:Uncharacterized protein n=1 Tax=Phytophthora rubi TaxID=129364 RepID=A0A6A3I933_9STRA|nr:hypothetical protein PR002_g25047 [Phytophthora rubi]